MTFSTDPKPAGLPIQLFLPKYRVDECLDQIRECFTAGWTGLGFKTLEFEAAWKTYTGLPHAHFLCSSTAGLHLSFHILKSELDWRDGDEIITTPLTFISTNHAILYERLKPVFADVDEHLCLDPLSVESRITERTRAVVFVGVGGNTGRLEQIADLCRRKDLRLILDAAHMAGTRLRGKHVGSEADVSIFCFSAVKNLPTADSGMICFRDEQYDSLARKLSWMGIDKDTYARATSQGAYKWKYDVEHVGFKYHGNSIMAAIGLVQLKYLDQDNGYRRQLASRYRTNLSSCGPVGLIPDLPECETAQHLFQIRVNNRDELIMALQAGQIYPGAHYRDNTEYPMYSHGGGTCPGAHRASEELVSVPLHLGLSKEDVDYISSCVRQYAGK